MTFEVKHAFESLKSDGVDATLVQPSAWNADHVLTQSPGTILGAVAGGGGVTVELPVAFDNSGNATFGATGYTMLAIGSTGQRPVTPIEGMERYNTLTHAKEFYNGANWLSILGSLTATGYLTVGGIGIQWGTLPVPPNTLGPANFAVPFTFGPYVVVITPISNTTGFVQNGPDFVAFANPGGFFIQNNTTGGVTYAWIAIGGLIL